MILCVRNVVSHIIEQREVLGYLRCGKCYVAAHSPTKDDPRMNIIIAHPMCKTHFGVKR
jgi:hypothetical protein